MNLGFFLKPPFMRSAAFDMLDLGRPFAVHGVKVRDLFAGIDRTSKVAATQLVEKANRKTDWDVLQHRLIAMPYQIHTILTDNGIQFAEQPQNRTTTH